MPSLGSWSWFSWLACILGQMLVITLIAQSGRRRFPAIFGYVCARTLADLTLLGIALCGDGDWKTWWYFYVYYFGAMVSAFFGVAIISQFLAAFVDSAEMRYSLQIGLRYVFAAYLIGSAVFSALSPLPFDERVVRFCVALERAYSLAWIAAFVCIVFAARWLRMAWPAKHKGMAAGFAVLSLGNLAHDWLLGVVPTHILSDVNAGFYLASLATWTITLRSAVRFPARLCPAPKLV